MRVIVTGGTGFIGRYVVTEARRPQMGQTLLTSQQQAARAFALPPGMILGKRAHIVGTVLRSRPIEEKISLAREFSDRMLPLFESGQLRPVIDRVFSFKEIRDAHRLMESDSNFGKIVLRWD